MQRFNKLQSLLVLLLAVAFINGAEVQQKKNGKRGLPLPVQDHSPNPHLLAAAASSGVNNPGVRPVSVTVHRSYPVAVPQPYAVHVPRPYPVTVHVPRPYPVAVPHPVPVAVPVPHPVPLLVRQQIGVPVAVPRLYPVPVPHPIPVPSPLLLGTGPSFPLAEYPRPYLPLINLNTASLPAEHPPQELPSAPPSPPTAPASGPSGEDAKDSPPPSLSPPPPPPSDTPTAPSLPPSNYHFTPNYKL